MLKSAPAPLAVLAFGLVALIGLIVLAGTGHLPASVQDTLDAIVVGSLTGGAGLAIPTHTHTADAPTADPLLPRGDPIRYVPAAVVGVGDAEPPAVGLAGGA